MVGPGCVLCHEATLSPTARIRSGLALPWEPVSWKQGPSMNGRPQRASRRNLWETEMAQEVKNNHSHSCSCGGRKRCSRESKKEKEHSESKRDLGIATELKLTRVAAGEVKGMREGDRNTRRWKVGGFTEDEKRTRRQARRLRDWGSGRRVFRRQRREERCLGQRTHFPLAAKSQSDEDRPSIRHNTEVSEHLEQK